MMSTEHVDLTDHLVLRGGTDPLLPPATRHTETTRVVLDWRQALGGLLILAGGIVLAVSWVGISGEAESYKQPPDFLSRGPGGGGPLPPGGGCFPPPGTFFDPRRIGQL